MGKNDKEKQMLYEWGKENSTEYHFRGIEKEKESYYIRRKTENDRKAYIREYGFETLPEFMKELDVLWENERVTETIKKAVGVAAIKNKPQEVIQKTAEVNKREDTGEKLPAFIYNF